MESHVIRQYGSANGGYVGFLPREASFATTLRNGDYP